MANERERQALFAKGRLLFDSCSIDKDYSCVLGYVDHNLALGGWRAEVIAEFIAWLKRQREIENEHGARAAAILQHIKECPDMETKLLYQTDSYFKQFNAKVLAIQDGALILDQTAFYPGGGGQPADAGAIRWQNQNLTLGKVEKKGDVVLHHLASSGPAAADEIEGVLDWERRYALMRTHTALHILCGVIWRDFGAQVTGGNMEPLKARMDFELERMSADFAERVEAAINREIEAGREIRVRILPREEAFQIPDLIRTKINLLPEGIPQVRTVEIIGLDLQADGGTHVANTREVGRIKIAGHESKGKINKRLRIIVE